MCNRRRGGVPDLSVPALTKEAAIEREPARLSLRAGAVVVPMPRAAVDGRLPRLVGPAERPSLVSPDRERPFAAAALTLLAHAAALLAWAYAPTAELPEPWKEGLVATIA